MTLHPAFAPFARLRRWCAWRSEWNSKTERWAKVPWVAPDRRARVDAPQMWLTEVRASGLVTVFEDQNATTGLGILLGDVSDDERLLALDLDAAVTESGSLKPWASAVRDIFARHYVEWSPSGSGVHVLALASRSAMQTLDEALAAVLPKHAKARRKFQRGRCADGEKAEAIEVLASGFVTVTSKPLPGSATSIRRVTDDDMRLLAAHVAAFLGANGPPLSDAPADAKPAAAEPSLPPQRQQQPSPGVRMIRAELRRLDRFAAKFDDATFQILLALWRHARRGPPGWARASAPYTRFATLPGLDRGSRLSRATIASRIRKLLASGELRVATAPTSPKPGARGLATVYDVPALLVRRPGAKAPPDDLIRVPATEWDGLLTLPGRLLRLRFRLLARYGAKPFAISAEEAGALIGADRKAGVAALAGLAERGWLRVEVSPDRFKKRPGVYLNTTPNHTPTPGILESNTAPCTGPIEPHAGGVASPPVAA